MQIIVYGAGTWGQECFIDYALNNEILFFVDKNSDLWDKCCSRTGVMIKSPQTLKDYPHVLVLIAVRECEGIQEYLREIGVQNIQLYVPSKKLRAYTNERMLAVNKDLMQELNEYRSLNLGAFLDTELFLPELAFLPGASSVLDYAFIRQCAQKYHCRNYLEVGTYIGESVNVVADLCEKCYSITAKLNSAYSMGPWCKALNMPDYSNRLVYKHNIIQYQCDNSQTFDFHNIKDDIDLYFIDADHSYNGVIGDTKNIFAHKNEKSIVIWHDLKNEKYITALAIKNAIGDDAWKNVFCVDTNMCAVYMPPIYQRDLPLKSCKYSDEPQELYVYDTVLRIHSK